MLRFVESDGKLGVGGDFRDGCARCDACLTQVGATEGVRWKGYPCTLLHAADFRVAKTP